MIVRVLTLEHRYPHEMPRGVRNWPLGPSLGWRINFSFCFFNNHPLTAPTSKVPVFLKRGKSWREEQDGSCKGARDAAAVVVIVCRLLSRAGNQKVLLVWSQHARSEAMTDSSTKAEGAARLCPLLRVEGRLKSSRLAGIHSWEQLEGGGDGGRESGGL